MRRGSSEGMLCSLPPGNREEQLKIEEAPQGLVAVALDEDETKTREEQPEAEEDQVGDKVLGALDEDSTKAVSPASGAHPPPKQLSLQDSRRSSKCFETRPGHHLSWDGADMKIVRKKGGTLHILDSVSGEVKPKELTCIMGQSGSGKTSLLNFLAGRLASMNNSRMELKGDIYIDGEKVDPTSINVQRKLAYTEQHDSLLATATPREAVLFAARLRLSRTISNDDITLLAESILDDLNLTEVADTLIGGERIRGLSGGEKRRVALGIQLVIRPNLLFLDEVTSGLDSNNAISVIEACKKVAKSGATVMMVIHQPSSEIFEMMDKLILMDHGQCTYHGPASAVPDYFASHGYPVPPNYNPADWIIKVQFSAEEAQLEQSGISFSDPVGSPEGLGASRIQSTDNFQRVSLWTETKVQVRRDILNLVRDSNGLLIRFGTIGVGTALLAIAYTGVGSDSLDSLISFSSHVGAIFLILVSTLIILQLTIVDFSEVRDAYVKELMTDHYRIFSFGLTKTLLEAWTTFLQCLMVMLIIYWSLHLTGRFWYLLMVLYAVTMANLSSAIAAGCLTSNPADAKELLPMILFPQLLFSGFFVNLQDMPEWIAWLQYLMPITYAFRLAIAEEFSECLDQNTSPVFCSEYLESQDATGSENAVYWVALFSFFAGIRCLALLLLRRRARG